LAAAGKIVPHLHRIQPFPTFIGRIAQNGGLRHNGLAPVEMHGFRISRHSSRCHVFASEDGDPEVFGHKYEQCVWRKMGTEHHLITTVTYSEQPWWQHNAVW